MVHVSGAICWASVLARQTQRSAHPPAAPPGDRDSRIDAIFSDPSVKRNLDARSPLNWANALLGGRFDILQTYGVSGDRTDQMMSRLATAIATGAGLLYLQCGLNDVGNNYPTATTSGATAAANIAAMCETATTAGMIVVLEIEVGSGTLSAAQVQQVNILNQLLYEYAATRPGVYLHDARVAVMSAAGYTGAKAWPRC